MAATDLPTIRADEVVIENGRLSRRLFRWIAAASLRMGGDVDKVDAAFVTANAAVPQTTNVVGAGGVHGGGALFGDQALVLWRAVTAVASLPTAGVAPGDLAFAVDGRKPGEGAGAGTGVPCFWSAGAWYSLCSGAVVTS